ncbi:hypothetical protein NFI95_08220 [Acetobacteraceae bacterium KSS8]|uniref:Uncharacterized protein n=1 Tax=Endosaccharibacter trunci TaxID=2812733 RepID=A0ABT1W6C6_9PROT|nr:hypothetical protein [Acetobacteraceae bacterium KSS8]
MRGTILGLAAGLAAMAGAAQAQTAQPDPAGLMRAIAAEPLRYGGDLEGGLLDLPEVGGRPVHIAMGLDAPAPDGAVRGRAILFDDARRMIAEGTIDGVIRPSETPSARSCGLKLTVDGVALPGGAPSPMLRPAGTVLMVGMCTGTTLAGEMRSAPPRPELLGRLIHWWGENDATGRFWLTEASFDPASTPAGTMRPAL